MEQELNTRSRQYTSGPQITPLTFDFRALIGGNLFDIPVSLPFPCNCFFLASISQGGESNSLVMYFNKLNYKQGTSFVTNWQGLEQVFYFNVGQQAAGQNYRSVIRFKEPVTQFFLAIGTENGSGQRFTIFATNDDELELSGGLYT